MTTTETSTTANGGAPARTETGSTGTDLDTLLNEFGGTPAPKPAPNQSAVKALEPVIEFARTEMHSRQKAALDSDIKSAVSFVRDDDAAKAIPEKFVRGFLEAQAAEDPSFAEAFQNRHTDKAVWQRKLGEAKSAFLEELKSLPGNSVKTDIEAARAAVQGRTEPAGDSRLPSAPELMAMSQREFDALVQKQIASTR